MSVYTIIIVSLPSWRKIQNQLINVQLCTVIVLMFLPGSSWLLSDSRPVSLSRHVGLNRSQHSFTSTKRNFFVLQNNRTSQYHNRSMSRSIPLRPKMTFRRLCIGADIETYQELWIFTDKCLLVDRQFFD